MVNRTLVERARKKYIYRKDREHFKGCRFSHPMSECLLTLSLLFPLFPSLLCTQNITSLSVCLCTKSSTSVLYFIFCNPLSRLLSRMRDSGCSWDSLEPVQINACSCHDLSTVLLLLQSRPKNRLHSLLSNTLIFRYFYYHSLHLYLTFRIV